MKKQTSLLIALAMSSSLAKANENTVVMSTVPAKATEQVTLSNYTQVPFNTWAFSNMGIHPSLMVSRSGDINALPVNLKPTYSAHEFEYGGKKINFQEAMIEDRTDGYIILHKGEVVHEAYFGDFSEKTHHLWASSTKSLVGQALGLLVEQGKVDPNELVSRYIEELKGIHFGDQTVRTLLNMTTGLNYSEDYVNMNPNDVHYEYFRRLGFIPAYDLMALDPTKTDEPRGLLSFASMFEANENLEPNVNFEYHSPNVDVIGWIISRVSGQSLDKFISDNIWSKLGVEHDAFFMADMTYQPIATGGFNTTLRDFARVGLAMENDGKYNGEQVFSQAWVKDSFSLTDEERKHTKGSIYKDDSSSAFDSNLEGYKNFLWVHDSVNNVATFRGVFGQILYINQEKELVIAAFSSADSASNASRETNKQRMAAFESLADSL